MLLESKTNTAFFLKMHLFSLDSRILSILAWNQGNFLFIEPLLREALGLELQGHCSHAAWGLTDPSSSPSSAPSQQLPWVSIFLSVKWDQRWNEVKSIEWLCDPRQAFPQQLLQLLRVRLGAGHQDGTAGLLLSRHPERQDRQHCQGTIQDRATGARTDNCVPQRVGHDYPWLGLTQRGEWYYY